MSASLVKIPHPFSFTPAMILCFFFPLLINCQCSRNPVIFIFGDSNSDTGAYYSGLGLMFGAPNGRSYFNQPTGESLNTSYLTPYLEPLGPDFRNGVNFAFSGAATQPRYKPFSLDVQILQFLRFRARSPELFSKGYEDFVDEDAFKDAIHIIDIGQNDLAGSFEYLSYEQVIKNISSFIKEINYAMQNIYQHGGRNFWIHNTGPLGCLPQKLATFDKKSSEFDQYGCLKTLNDAAKQFNDQLRVLCEELRSELKNSTIVYVDMYSIKYDLIANATTYGFENSLMACCGYGGPPYNYNPIITCSRAGYSVCERGSKFISWDGVHYTEAANAVVASKILSTNYSTPQIKFSYFCSN